MSSTTITSMLSTSTEHSNPQKKRNHLNWLYRMNGKKDFVVQKQGKKNSHRILYPSGKYTVEKRVNYVPDGGDFAFPKKMTLTEIRTMAKKDVVELVNNRQVLPFEIVFDFDGKASEGTAYAHAQSLFQSYSLLSTVWHSGNKGHHIHLFVKELLVYSPEDRSIIRDIFFDELKSRVGKDDCPDTQLRSDNVTIQLEYAKHRKTQRDKSLLEGEIAMNESLPDEIKREFLRRKIHETVREATTKYEIPKDGTYQKECIEYFRLNEIPEGNRERVLFALLSNLRHSVDEETLLNRARDFNFFHDSFLRPFELRNKVRRAMKGKTCHCRYIRPILKDIGQEQLCDSCVWRGT